MSYESPSHLSHPLALHGWAVGGTCHFLGFNWNLKAAGKAPFNKFCVICLLHIPLAEEHRFEPSINCLHKTRILTRPGCTGNHGNQSGRMSAFGSLHQYSANLSLGSPGQPDCCLPRSNHWHSDSQLFQHLIWRLLYVHCQMLDSGELGKRPQLVWKFSQWLHRWLGTAPVISCSVICTIRTAFLPEAFEEQLQKQIAAAVAGVIAAERKEKRQTDKSIKQDVPPPPPCQDHAHLLWKCLVFHARLQRLNLIKKNSS